MCIQPINYVVQLRQLSRNKPIMPQVNPFTVEVPDETIEFIKSRVAAFPWHEMPADGGWDFGTNLPYMKEFCDYWVSAFDWRKQEAQINQLSHFNTPINGIDIHFIHEKGSGPNPRPLIISHGWPGTLHCVQSYSRISGFY